MVLRNNRRFEGRGGYFFFAAKMPITLNITKQN
jgi:hypothetical protein